MPANRIREELDDVILACDLPEHGLKRGDLGTLLAVYPGGAGYEVEFTSMDGEKVVVVTLLRHQLRPV